MKGIDVDSWVPNRGQTRLWFSLPSSLFDSFAPLSLSIFLFPFCRFLFLFLSSSTHLIHRSFIPCHSLIPSQLLATQLKASPFMDRKKKWKNWRRRSGRRKKKNWRRRGMRITWHQLVNQLINQQKKGERKSFSPFSFILFLFLSSFFSSRFLFFSLPSFYFFLSLFCLIVCILYSLSNYLVLLWLLRISVFLLSSSSFFSKTY